MKYTPIPDNEAARIAKVSRGTIRNAVKRGDLTRVPTVGQVQHVIKEQVELFVDRSQIKFESLSKEERQTWKKLEESVKAPVTTFVDSTSAVTSQDMTPIEREYYARVRGYNDLVTRGEMSPKECVQYIWAYSQTIPPNNIDTSNLTLINDPVSR